MRHLVQDRAVHRFDEQVHVVCPVVERFFEQVEERCVDADLIDAPGHAVINTGRRSVGIVPARPRSGDETDQRRRSVFEVGPAIIRVGKIAPFEECRHDAVVVRNRPIEAAVHPPEENRKLLFRVGADSDHVALPNDS